MMEDPSCDSVVSWMGMMVMIMMARWLAVLWKIVAIIARFEMVMGTKFCFLYLIN